MKNGEKIQVYRASDAAEEAEHVVQVIREFHQRHPEVPFSQIAILYRTNAQCNYVIISLSLFLNRLN